MDDLQPGSRACFRHDPCASAITKMHIHDGLTPHGVERTSAGMSRLVSARRRRDKHRPEPIGGIEAGHCIDRVFKDGNVHAESRSFGMTAAEAIQPELDLMKRRVEAPWRTWTGALASG